jgi:hypothetical protein
LGFDLIYIQQEALGCISLGSGRFETVLQKIWTVLKLFEMAVFGSKIRWAVEIRNMAFLLDIFARQWFPSFDGGIALLTEPLLFETARPAARAHTLNQRLNQIADLGLVGDIELLKASLNLRFGILWI